MDLNQLTNTNLELKPLMIPDLIKMYINLVLQCVEHMNSQMNLDPVLPWPTQDLKLQIWEML